MGTPTDMSFHGCVEQRDHIPMAALEQRRKEARARMIHYGPHPLPPVSTAGSLARKRGRPKGAKDRAPRKGRGKEKNLPMQAYEGRTMDPPDFVAIEKMERDAKLGEPVEAYPGRTMSPPDFIALERQASYPGRMMSPPDYVALERANPAGTRIERFGAIPKKRSKK